MELSLGPAVRMEHPKTAELLEIPLIAPFRPSQGFREAVRVRAISSLHHLPEPSMEQDCTWAGRSQIVEAPGGRTFYLDGAHTPKSIRVGHSPP